MNNNQTIEKLKQMRLDAMANLHLQQQKDNQLDSFTIDEYLALLTDHEWEHRKDRKITRFIKQANFRQSASLADINYTQSRNLNKNMFSRRSEEHTSELQSRGHLVCHLLLEK